MIRILIVDDSATVRQLLTYELSRQEDMQVVGTAVNGLEAVKQAEKLHPDIITMDVQMPIMDGLKATQEIMRTRARPIIIVSQYWNQEDKQKTFEALEAGAVSVANKPAGPGHPDHDESLVHLLRTIRIMSEIKMVTRRRGKSDPAPDSTEILKKNGVACPPPCRPDCPLGNLHAKLVVIGASTGGPVVLREIFARIPPPYPLPILVVQHIAPGFLPGLVEWLSKITGHTVDIGRHGIRPEAGHIYFAPDNRHMGLDLN